MGTISTGIGLISGLNTGEIIDQLIALQSRPVQLLDQRIEDLTNKQAGLLSISAYLHTIDGLVQRLADEDTFNVREATSSNENVLTATAGAGAPVGTFSFTVSQLVQTHQMVSNGFVDADSTPVGEGTITIEVGQGFLTSDTPVSFLNGQTGIDRGSIRITDRSGASAVIDLSDVVTVTDILDRINSNPDVDVTATVSGDRIVITDNTGQTASNLVVADVGSDTTATDLGIATSVADGQIVGNPIVWLTPNTPLNLLNDGNGVRHRVGFDDFRITLRDGSTIDVNVSGASTLGEVLDAINNDEENAGKLTAQLSSDGLSIELVDSTGGTGDLTVTALNDSMAAYDLGLLKGVADNTLTGDRLVAGLNSVLLRSLNGGSGVELGSIRIVDRAGTESIVDLSSAQTVQDVIDLINDSSVAAQVTASLNAAGNGLRITDNTGSTTNPLIVTNYGSTTTASDLGIDTTSSGINANRVEGTDLERRYISENTPLSVLNGGRGVAAGRFLITDSTGRSATVDLSQTDDTTIGDVIQEINSRGLSVVASINSTGDGILLTDTGGGTGRLTVSEVDNGTTAADLGILGSAPEGSNVIDGSFEYTITVDADDTLQDVAAAINSADIPVSAAIINDGSPGSPYRLTLTSDYSGRLGRLLVDTGSTGLSMSTLVEGRDARVLFGSGSGGDPIVLTSHTNSLTGVIDEVTIDLVGTSSSPVTLSITTDTDSIVSTVGQLVDSINSALEGIDELISYDSESQTRGVLQGDMTAQRVRSLLYSLVTRRFSGVNGPYTSLRDIGITINEDNEVQLDEDRLRQVLGNGLTHIRDLFTTDNYGVADVFENRLEPYISENPGLIERRVESLDDRIRMLNKQRERYQARLDAERRRLQLQFAQMELSLARLQDQQRSLGAFPIITPGVGARGGMSLL